MLNKIRKIGDYYLLLLLNPPKTIKTASIKPVRGTPVSCIPTVFVVELVMLAAEMLLLTTSAGVDVLAWIGLP